MAGRYIAKCSFWATMVYKNCFFCINFRLSGGRLNSKTCVSSCSSRRKTCSCPWLRVPIVSDSSKNWLALHVSPASAGEDCDVMSVPEEAWFARRFEDLSDQMMCPLQISWWAHPRSPELGADHGSSMLSEVVAFVEFADLAGMETSLLHGLAR